jgi:hypothetical protein
MTLYRFGADGQKLLRRFACALLISPRLKRARWSPILSAKDDGATVFSMIRPTPGNSVLILVGVPILGSVAVFLTAAFGEKTSFWGFVTLAIVIFVAVLAAILTSRVARSLHRKHAHAILSILVSSSYFVLMPWFLCEEFLGRKFFGLWFWTFLTFLFVAIATLYFCLSASRSRMLLVDQMVAVGRAHNSGPIGVVGLCLYAGVMIFFGESFDITISNAFKILLVILCLPFFAILLHGALSSLFSVPVETSATG